MLVLPAALAIIYVHLHSTHINSAHVDCASCLRTGANLFAVHQLVSASGARSAQVVITDNASGSPHMVSLSGTGVSVTPSDFAVSAMPQSAGLSSGQSAIFILSVTASGGFNQNVTFACSGLPAGASCSSAPASVAPGASSAATTTLTITTTLRSAAIFRMPLSYLRYRTVESFLLCSLLYISICTAKKAHQIRPPAVLTPWFASILNVLVFSLVGCSSTNSVGPVQSPGSGTPAGNYSVSVTASSGNLTHQLALSLTVR